jgi:hypothetical protein
VAKNANLAFKKMCHYVKNAPTGAELWRKLVSLEVEEDWITRKLTTKTDVEVATDVMNGCLDSFKKINKDLGAAKKRFMKASTRKHFGWLCKEFVLKLESYYARRLKKYLRQYDDDKRLKDFVWYRNKAAEKIELLMPVIKFAEEVLDPARTMEEIDGQRLAVQRKRKTRSRNKNKNR